MSRLARIAFLALLAALAAGPAPQGALAQERPAFSQAELDQMIAPVALYPDPLLSQMLMAATYPLEVVEAARWSSAHPDLRGDAAVKAALGEGWDPSVTSLVAFPQVLAWMDENLKWTTAVGDAFLAQQPQLMETVQNLRARAQGAGTLRSDDRVVVSQEGPTIVVVPADPQVVYVPYYDPFVVYGSWWWVDYPPVRWRPWRGYVARPGVVVVWTPGIRVTSGFFFGGIDWRQRQARVVRVNNYYYSRTVTVNREVTVNRAPGTWQHDPGHRRGIGYRDAAVQRRFAATAPAQREPSRAPAQPGAARAISPPPAIRDERRGELRDERRGEERRAEPQRRGEERRNRRAEEPREQRESAPGGFAPGRGGFSPGPGGLGPLPGGLGPLPGGLPPLPGGHQQREPGAQLQPARDHREHVRDGERRRHGEHRPA
jgi:uncharacterized protein DUF3300